MYSKQCHVTESYFGLEDMLIKDLCYDTGLHSDQLTAWSIRRKERCKLNSIYCKMERIKSPLEILPCSRWLAIYLSVEIFLKLFEGNVSHFPVTLFIIVTEKVYNA